MEKQYINSVHNSVGPEQAMDGEKKFVVQLRFWQAIAEVYM